VPNIVGECAMSQTIGSGERGGKERRGVSDFGTLGVAFVFFALAAQTGSWLSWSCLFISWCWKIIEMYALISCVNLEYINDNFRN
jgi:hypothetical protein